jgi:hypothetical protein
MRVIVLCALLALVTAAAHAQQQRPVPVDRLQALSFLLGEWTGEGGGTPGKASAGGFTFQFQLDGKLLVRKNYADYPATKDRPAFFHQDLLVIYLEANELRAIYFDNEGHVIHYIVTISEARGVAEFVSPAAPDAPRYRLTHRETGAATQEIKFEIAPPGKPEAFATYVTATARRR